ncbi:MAG: helix-turn-helix domain-containing protein [Lachnospiraceae bacterium]|nr:helix-turn-helix domain-containing protein [Lachnospiraceae bacterium]
MEKKKGKRGLLKELEMIAYFRRYSIFYRFFALILFMVIVLIVSFSLYISKVIESGAREQYDQANEQMLIRAVNQMDNSLFFLEQILFVAGNNKYVVDAAIRPGLTYDERNRNVVSFLKEIRRNNQFISGVWLYERTNETVLCADGTVMSLSEYSYEGALDGILRETEDGEDIVVIRNTAKNRSMLVSREGAMYVVFESLQSKDGPFLSKLIAKLNVEYLFQDAMEEISAANCGLITLDWRGENIFSNEKSWNLPNRGQSIIHASSYTGWSYEMYPEAYEGNGWIFYLRQILPFLVVATLASLIFALVVAEKIYAPISRLTKHFSQGNGKILSPGFQGDKNNEIGFLHQAYTEILQDKEKADVLLLDIRPDLERKLFLSMIHGSEYTELQLEQRLRDIRSEFQVQANYRVMLICFLDLDEREDMASYLSMRDLEQGIAELFPREEGQLLHMQRNDTIILVMQYPREYSVARINSVQLYFEEQMRQMLRMRKVEVTVASGRVCRSLKDMPLSYEEASDHLRRQIYFQNDGTPEPVFGDTVQDYFLQQLTQLSDHLSKSHMGEAEDQLKKILAEFREREVDFSFRKYYYEQLLDHLVEKSMQFYGEQNCFSTEEYQEIYRKLQKLTDEEELAGYGEQVLGQQFAFIRTQSLRRQNRIVAKAREYIDENYDRGDLSIQLIAESIGINASYLSNLFATCTGENLVSYINEYRINVAIHLLLNTTISIKEIGYKTGFNTAQNFNRVFKRVTGRTPSKYREQRLEESSREHR